MSRFPYFASETIARLKTVGILDLQKSKAASSCSKFIVVSDKMSPLKPMLHAMEGRGFPEIQHVRLNISGDHIESELSRVLDIAEKQAGSAGIILATEQPTKGKGWFNSPVICGRIARSSVPVIFVTHEHSIEMSAIERVSFKGLSSYDHLLSFLDNLCHQQIDYEVSQIRSLEEKFNLVLNRKKEPQAAEVIPSIEMGKLSSLEEVFISSIKIKSLRSQAELERLTITFESELMSARS